MNKAMIALTIQNLRRLPVAGQDQALCQMHKDDLLDIGLALGLRLPFFGGDKPAVIVAALQLP